MLAGLVQRLAFGTVLLHFGELRRVKLRILRERVVDLLHVLRAMERECAAGREDQRGGERDAALPHFGASLVDLMRFPGAGGKQACVPATRKDTPDGRRVNRTPSPAPRRARCRPSSRWRAHSAPAAASRSATIPARPAAP